MTYEELMERAIEASKNSYSPYSKFAVCACLETSDGKIYSGCTASRLKSSVSNFPTEDLCTV